MEPCVLPRVFGYSVLIKTLVWRPLQRLIDFMSGSATGGLVLMGTAALAMVVANSPLGPAYFDALHVELGPLSVLHWINDGLMAIFFLLVGLEIKREFIDGELASNRLRILPGLAAFGGMAVPALIYLAINWNSGDAANGWAIPSATDIAFALGVAALLGSRVPASLKAFLAALAIIDDLGAVIIIAVFYTPGLDLLYLGLSAAVVAAMAVANRLGVRSLWPYLTLGVVLWICVHASGVHATLAGVATALCIPLRDGEGRLPSDGDCTHSPLLRLEHALHRLVPITVLPLFGFANAGISFAGLGVDAWLASTTLGVGLGLAVGKLVGVFGTSWLAVRLGWAEMPREASTVQLLGTALLCGIGFTMSLFIGMLAFPTHPELQDEAKLGILAGSVLAGLAGWLVLRTASKRAG
ncbi:Na+/H+ antiporter NhaA [Luteibacter flocculans]|uniref:Na(+)/H(+) antiporter NhaA n=1 Tax=Luteibacter flocculans TaxID=2780091 RepID=A0ABY4T5B2_9GAMM|nr:Na+/H+ antiporter NhaA [Luteibacter flocculans]